MKTITLLLFIMLSTSLVSAEICERAIISRVANEYNLNKEETALLFAIRKAENGKTPKEFGVLNKQAMRFKDPVKSLECQARWCAGTIKKRYKGDLEAFGARYCPVGAENDPTGLNKNWVKNVKNFMERG